MPATAKPIRVLRRFGIGEWYGKLFTELTADERTELVAQASVRGALPNVPCPFLSRPNHSERCNKRGGVCSLRLYARDADSGAGVVVPGNEGRLRTTCPNRFRENAMIYRWVGETLLGNPAPVVLGEIGFLSRSTAISGPGREDPVEAADDVGRIDNVLVAEDGGRLSWCALEIQAVYFQGSGMGEDFSAIARHSGAGVPFPVGTRRLDYRSSGPKRLMPQLEIKVPSLRRWGKKTAVVVDEDFFAALSPMEEVSDVSNCDIAWFVVRYEETAGRVILVPNRVALTTLERAVEGLTAGLPVTLNEFERRIRLKMSELQA